MIPDCGWDRYIIPGENGSLKPGERIFNWVWYCNYAENSEELKDIMTDSEGHFYPGRYSMPIGKIRPSIWNRQKDVAAEILPSQLADTVKKTTHPFIQSINESECQLSFCLITLKNSRGEFLLSNTILILPCAFFLNRTMLTPRIGEHSKIASCLVF